MIKGQTYSLLVLICCIFRQVATLHINIPAHGSECFYEDLEQDDKITLTYEVAEGGHYEIDFYITNPQHAIWISESQKERGAYTITGESPGRYTYCFSNARSGVTVKSVGFNVHRHEKINDHDDEDPLLLEIGELADSIFNIKVQQEYLVAREKRLRDTVESTNDRVKWWSIAQISLLMMVCLWQTHYIKHFFQVKHVVFS